MYNYHTQFYDLILSHKIKYQIYKKRDQVRDERIFTGFITYVYDIN